MTRLFWRSFCFIYLSGPDMTKWDVPFGNVLLQQSLIITYWKWISVGLVLVFPWLVGAEAVVVINLLMSQRWCDAGPVMDTEHTDTCEGSDVMPWWYWAFTPSHWAKYIIICVVLCYSMILFILMYKHSSWSFVVCKRFISPVFMTL